MRKLCSFFLLLFISVTGLSQVPVLQWQKTFGGSASDQSYCVQQTTDGGYIIGGKTGSTTGGDIVGSGSHGGQEGWLIKTDGSGVIEWKRCYGGSGTDFFQGNCVKQTPDGGYIAAGTSQSSNGDLTGNNGGSDIWVVKTDNLGAIQWQKNIGGSEADESRSVSLTPDGGYLVGGYTRSANGDFTLNKGGYDYVIIKLDASGNIVWQKTYGGTGDDLVSSTEVAADGHYYVAGYSGSKDGDVLSTRDGDDWWILKLNSSTGDIIWKKFFGSSNRDWAQSIRKTSDGGCIVAGYISAADFDVVFDPPISYAPQNHYWIIKLDNAGTMQWQKLLGGSGHDFATNIVQTKDGGYVVAGTSTSVDGDVTTVNRGNTDHWIVKLSPTGAIEWQKSMGGSMYDRPEGIAITSDHGYIITGFTQSRDFDVTFYNGGTYDWWVTKLSPCPSYSDITETICPGDTYDFNGAPLSAAGTYTATLTSQYGCDSIVELTLSLYSTSAPVITVANVNELSTGNYSSYQWLFNDQPIPGAIAQTYTGTQNGNYRVTVMTPDGCEVMSQPFRLLLNANLYVPNMFTPNSDGKNDLLRVYGNGIAGGYLQIYNQWGQKIFETRDVSTGWDGRTGGKAQPVGVYMYVVQVTLSDGTVLNKKGSVNLIR